MSSPMDEDLWRGTSDTRSVLRARAATTPAQRLEWLEETLLLAEASGTLARDRARRQQLADRWAAQALSVVPTRR